MSGGGSDPRSRGIRTHRHDIASLFQSVADDVARALDRKAGTASAERGTTEGERPVLAHPLVAAAEAVAGHMERGREPPDDPPEGLAASHGGEVSDLWECTKLAARLVEKKFLGDDEAARKIEDELKFSDCDPAWAEAIVDYEEYFGPSGHAKEIPYVRWEDMDDFVLPALPRNARVALIADWGTGTDAAERLLREVAEHEPDVLVHLGDIYYAGTTEECRRWFLGVIDDVFDRRRRPMPVYTLSGNHDMYSGGTGYYGVLPELNPSPPLDDDVAQRASYFSLRDPSGTWQLQAMDTGLHDHDPFTVSSDVTWLDPDEVAWHVDKVERFSAEGGRTILLSHHPLFSGFEGIGDYGDREPDVRALNPHLLSSYRHFQQAADGSPGDVAAWFWGHEHSLYVYRPYRGLERGRCIGHGAIPVFAEDDPYAPLSDLEDPPELVEAPGGDGPLRLPVDGDVYAHGYVILDLDASGTAAAGYYVAGRDEPIYRERF